MKSFRGVILLIGTCSAWNGTPASAQEHPGLAPYTPTRIQWMEIQAAVTFNHEATSEEPYLLRIVATDPETLTIRVRYNPVLDQANNNDFSPKGITLQAAHNGMVASIQTAKAGIQALAKAAGWKWVKVTEDIKNYKQEMDNP